MVPPGFSAPSRSACSIMASAGRSLTLPPGFSISSLAATLHVSPSVTRLSRTNGVSPIRSISESAICASGSGCSIARPFGR